MFIFEYLCYNLCLKENYHLWIFLLWLSVINYNFFLFKFQIALTRGVFFISIIMCIVLFLFPILSEEPWTLTSKEIYSESMGTFLFIVSQLLHLVAGDAISSAITLMSATILLYVILDELTMNLQGIFLLSFFSIFNIIIVWIFISWNGSLCWFCKLKYSGCNMNVLFFSHSLICYISRDYNFF